MKTTGIAWARSTFNPWIGCTRVGPGCDHCYAAVSTPARAMAIGWGAGKPRHRTSPSNWRQPVLWNAEQASLYKVWRPGMAPIAPWRVFCASLADVFDNEVPNQWRLDLWSLVLDTPYLTWLFVTKRIGNARHMLPTSWLMDQMPSNVWLLATVVNQDEFDRDWPKLCELPARVLGLSCEPLLAPITFPKDVRGRLHWVILGGESDQPGYPPARECAVPWLEDSLCQAHQHGIPAFVKQLGHHATIGRGGAVVPYGTGKRDNPAHWPQRLRVQEFPA